MRVLRNHLTLWLLILALGLTALIYAPGLHSGFLFDDSINITENPKLHIKSLSWQEVQRAVSSSNAGPLGRPVSMLSFAVNHALTGLDPFYFKLTNLVVHLFNGVSLWLLSWLLLTNYHQRYPDSVQIKLIPWLSLAVSAAWLLHPFNLTSVLYIVQRMASLAVLFMVWGLIFYAWGRLRQQQGRSGAVQIVTGLVVFGGLAALSKENGVLLPFLILITEWTLFSFRADNRDSKKFVIAFNWITAILPALLIILFLIIRFDWLVDTYVYRDFTLIERLLTQARVIWFYIHMILLPDTTQMGLYHDDIILSNGLLHPWSTLPAVIGVFILLVGAVWLRKAAPILSFGVLFFFVGHAMESTVLSLEIAHEHRNYLPSYGLIVVVFYYLLHPTLQQKLSLKFQAGLCAVLISLLAVCTAIRTSYWSNDVDLALVTVRHHPESARSNLEAGTIYFKLGEALPKPNDYHLKARQYFEAARRSDSYGLTGSFALLVIDDREQKPVDWALVDQIADKLRNRPLAPSSVNSLIRLNRCQTDSGPCKVPTEVMHRLFQSILQNPTLFNRGRSQIISELAQFAISLEDYPIAAYLSRQAINFNPNDPQVRLNYAHMLIALGEYTAAQQEIEKARLFDEDAFYADKIRAQEDLLNNMKRAKSEPEKARPNLEHMPDVYKP